MAKGIRTNTPLCEKRKGSFVATAHIALLEEKNNGSFFSLFLWQAISELGAPRKKREKREKRRKTEEEEGNINRFKVKVLTQPLCRWANMARKMHRH